MIDDVDEGALLHDVARMISAGVHGLEALTRYDTARASMYRHWARHLHEDWKSIALLAERFAEAPER